MVLRIILVVGVRPEFIQCTQVVQELSKEFRTEIIHTGQHYDYLMDKIFFKELDIPEPSYYLNVGSGSHGLQTGKMLINIEKIFFNTSPDFIIVFGDTNSTLAGALAASKLHIKVIHIEAGMRSHDRSMPEEINRLLVDHCSDFLFCPTKTAVKNLKNEGITDNVFLSGDATADALRKYITVAEKKSNILNELDISPNEYLLTTIHRASNTDNINNLKNIVEALILSARQIVFPVHPRTREVLLKSNLIDSIKRFENIKIIPPVGYLDFIQLLKNSEKVLTDSGGIQKEAYILKIPCITLRENTEWIETVHEGWNVLTGANKESILKMINEFHPPKRYKNIFGEGAARNILNYLKNHISNNSTNS